MNHGNNSKGASIINTYRIQIINIIIRNYINGISNFIIFIRSSSPLMNKGYVCSDSGCDAIPGLLNDSDVVFQIKMLQASIRQ